ncbi:MAG: ATP-dependent DNA helicase [Salinisphaera sp.]|nr:ATP-dependent DNA helicase [Salinisphaera sp.]
MSSVFAADGPLAAKLAGYAPRAAQQEMAESVAKTIAAGGRLLVEAGTGTGKTLAYLVPALASGHRVILSTATRHLQEQILSHDVPLARAALGCNPKVALLKGRGNYLCLHRLLRGQGLDDAEAPGLADELRAVRAWSARTRSGDLSEVGDIDDGSAVWPRVSATADQCLGGECPQFERCWVFSARRAAQAADLVIVNHHLLFADLNLRESGFGELLPGAGAIILDEAHRLPEIAGQFFGQTLSSRQLRDLVSDGRIEAQAIGADMPDLIDALADVAEAEAAFAQSLPVESGAIAWAALDTAVESQAHALVGAICKLAASAQAVAERASTLAALGQRAKALADCGAALLGGDEDSVCWIERRGKGWRWHATPLDVAPPFQRALDTHKAAWIFTSATLSVHGELAYFSRRLGLQDAAGLILDSPFDYQRNSLLYLPASMPQPQEADFDDAFAGLAAELIAASGGGAFVLCTSHRGLRACAARLRQHLSTSLLIQGDAGRSVLLDRFRERQDAVLIGTTSFWEGVDVRGPSLRLVIIDRLPFASPADPVLSARIAAMRQRGEVPFIQYQLPQAVLALKQGVGRLIRDSQDRGLLAICDPRMTTRSYGRVFLDSLPDMPVTRDADQATAFLLAGRPA